MFTVYQKTIKDDWLSIRKFPLYRDVVAFCLSSTPDVAEIVVHDGACQIVIHISNGVLVYPR